MSNFESPEYSHPPLAEMVLGVQFDSIEGFHDGYLGRFWERLGSEWPYSSVAPEIQEQFEFLDNTLLPKIASLTFTDQLHSRLKIENLSKSRMLQIQHNRLHLNWTGYSSGESYPRFNSLQPEFSKYYESFIEFLADAKLPAPKPNQWELTYVNHLEKGVLWNSPSEWSRLFESGLGPLTGVEGTALEVVHWRSMHEILPSRGRLHTELRHGRRAGSAEGNNELMNLSITARGPLHGENQEIVDRLCLGNRSIVAHFESVMSEFAKTHWR